MRVKKILLYVLLLSFSMSSTCYNGGSEYLQVFRGTSTEIKTLLQDVVQQLKKQNKKAERMIKHLESQTEKVGEVFHHLKGQNDHLGELLRNLDTQDRHMDQVLKKIKKLNASDYSSDEDLSSELGEYRRYQPSPGLSSFTRSGSLTQFRNLDKNIGQVFRNFKSPQDEYEYYDSEYEDYMDEEYGSDSFNKPKDILSLRKINSYSEDYMDEDYESDSFSKTKDILSLRKINSYSPVHSITNYDNNRPNDDKIFDFSENRRKSHQDFLSFVSNNSRNMRLDKNESGRNSHSTGECSLIFNSYSIEFHECFH